MKEFGSQSTKRTSKDNESTQQVARLRLRLRPGLRLGLRLSVSVDAVAETEVSVQ